LKELDILFTFSNQKLTSYSKRSIRQNQEECIIKTNIWQCKNEWEDDPSVINSILFLQTTALVTDVLASCGCHNKAIKLSRLNNKKLLYHSSGGLKSEIKVSAKLVSSDNCEGETPASCLLDSNSVRHSVVCR
jgi:hypothetical protein